jgi:hypothetical protein
MSSNNNSNSNTPDSETSTNIPLTDEARRIAQQNEMPTDDNRTLLQMGLRPNNIGEFYVEGKDINNDLHGEASDSNSNSDTDIDEDNNKLPLGNLGTRYVGEKVDALDDLMKQQKKQKTKNPLTRTLTNPLGSVDEGLDVMNGRVNKMLENIITEFLYNDNINNQIKKPFTNDMNIDTVKYLMPKEAAIDPSFNKLVNNDYKLSENLFDIVKEEEDENVGGNSTQVSTTSSAFSQAPSSVVNDFAKRFELSKLYNSSGNNAVNPFSTIFNEVCKYRHKPQVIKTNKSGDKTTVDLQAIRNIACNKIGEETQMSDIWGGQIVSYAMGLHTDGDKTNPQTHKGLTNFLHGDGKDFYRLGKNNKIEIPELGFPKCYICQQDIIPAWGEVTFGSRGRRRICPEMEHKYPCISAFTRSPTYVILNKYKCKLINNSRDDTYLKAWKYFNNDGNNFKDLLALYKNINCTQTFNKAVINDNFNKIKSNFEALFVKEHLDQGVFEWAFSVIKYWCHEFAYSHHTCNMAKSNLDFSKLGNDHDDLNTQKTKIKTFISNCVTRFSTKGDTLSAFEKKWILVSNNKKHDAKGIAFTSLFKQNDLEDRLLNVFNEMDKITNEIVKNYSDVTSVLKERQIQTNSNEEGGKLTKNEEKTIKNVLIGKGLMIMYKRYKETAKVKNNTKKTSSSSKTKRKINGSPNNKTKKAKPDKTQRNIAKMLGLQEEPKEQQKTIPTLFSKQKQEQEQEKKPNQRYNTRRTRRGGKKSKRRTLKKKYKK